MTKTEINGQKCAILDQETAELLIYNEEIRIIIDLADILGITGYKWLLYRNRPYTKNVEGQNRVFMGRLLLNITDPNIAVVYKDSNSLNNKRNNLMTVERKYLSNFRIKPRKYTSPKEPESWYNTDYPINKHFGKYTPIKYIGDGRYRCLIPTHDYTSHRQSLSKSSGIAEVSITQLWRAIEHEQVRNSMQYEEDESITGRLIDNGIGVILGWQLVPDPKPLTIKYDRYSRPEPESWSRSGKVIVNYEGRLRVMKLLRKDNDKENNECR